MEITHKNLCGVAVKWLKRANSNGGPGCHLAVSEVASGFDGEIPDAIGFRAAGYRDDGSIVVEVKISRNDFLEDQKKKHRTGEVLGMGNWRFYLCPTGLIKPDELLPNWGLLYVNTRGHVEHIINPFVENYDEKMEWLLANRFEVDQERQQYLLVKLLSKINDPEKLSNSIKSYRNKAARLLRETESQREQINGHRKLMESQRKKDRLRYKRSRLALCWAWRELRSKKRNRAA